MNNIDIHRNYIVPGRDLALLEGTIHEARRTNRLSDITVIEFQFGTMIDNSEVM